MSETFKKHLILLKILLKVLTIANLEVCRGKIKRDLVSAPDWIRPDFSTEFQVYYDTFSFAIEAGLTQEVDERHHSIVFVNRSLTSSENLLTSNFRTLW